jgi:hypothetical protein
VAVVAAEVLDPQLDAKRDPLRRRPLLHQCKKPLSNGARVSSIASPSRAASATGVKGGWCLKGTGMRTLGELID